MWIFLDAVLVAAGYVTSVYSWPSIKIWINGASTEAANLRQKAARGRKSLNRVILEELTAATIGSQCKADFSDIVGKWTPDPAFDAILAAQRQIDWDKWK